MRGFRLPGLDLSMWDSLDIILYNLAGKYQPQHEGDKMLVELAHVSAKPGIFLRRCGERGILQMNSGAWAEPSKW